MKTLPIVYLVLMAILASLMTAERAHADSFVRVGVETEDFRVPTLTNLTLHKFEESKFGISCFFQVTPGWGQAYAGPTWSPTKHLQLGVSAGAEQKGGVYAPRFASFLWFEYKTLSGIGIVEWNDTWLKEMWYNVQVRKKMSEHTALGIQSRRFLGTGLELRVEVPRISLTVFGAWLPIDIDGRRIRAERSIIGFDFTL